MANDKYTSDDEYQFSDVESADVFGTQQPDGMGHSNIIRRNLIIGVGVIAVIFAVYKLLGAFFTPKTPKKATATKTEITRITPTPVPKPIQTPAKVAVPSFPTTPSKTVDNKAVNALNQKIENLVSNQAQSQRSEIQRLDSNINDLKNQLNQVNNQLSELTRSNKMLNEMLVKLTTPPKPKVVKKRKRVRAIPPARRTYYHIEAIIPGRAWIKSKTGSTLTVSRGTNVPGYGRVVSVQPQQGKVLTSSGKIIRYKPEDR